MLDFSEYNNAVDKLFEKQTENNILYYLQTHNEQGFIDANKIYKK